MSTKINIFKIIKGHHSTLKNYKTDRISVCDVITFYVIPFSVAFFFWFSEISLSEGFVSAVIDFTSIITSLLVSVLVLVYDQLDRIQDKIDDNSLNKEDSRIQLKLLLLKEVFSNISYTILIGIMAIIFCLVFYMFPCIINILTPIIMFLLLQMLLTLLMSLKRLYSLFEAKTT